MDKRRFTRHLWLLALPVMAVMAFAIFQPIRVLPRIGIAPAYSLVDQEGNKFTSENVRGKLVLYTVSGMALFANSYHLLGLEESVPRRSELGSATYFMSAWRPYLMESAVGIFLLFISATLFFGVVFATVLLPGRKLKTPVEMPVAEPLHKEKLLPWLDNWTPWVSGAIALIVISYGPMLFQLIRDAQNIPFIRHIW